MPASRGVDPSVLTAVISVLSHSSRRSSVARSKISANVDATSIRLIMSVWTPKDSSSWSLSCIICVIAVCSRSICASSMVRNAHSIPVSCCWNSSSVFSACICSLSLCCAFSAFMCHCIACSLCVSERSACPCSVRTTHASISCCLPAWFSKSCAFCSSFFRTCSTGFKFGATVLRSVYSCPSSRCSHVSPAVKHSDSPTGNAPLTMFRRFSFVIANVVGCTGSAPVIIFCNRARMCVSTMFLTCLCTLLMPPPALMHCHLQPSFDAAAILVV